MRPHPEQVTGGYANAVKTSPAQNPLTASSQPPPFLLTLLSASLVPGSENQLEE